MPIEIEERPATRTGPAGSNRVATPVEPNRAAEYTLANRPSDTIGTVFQVLLGIAACLALLAVVQQARDPQADPTGVDAPPPAVFTQTD